MTEIGQMDWEATLIVEHGPKHGMVVYGLPGDPSRDQPVSLGKAGSSCDLDMLGVWLCQSNQGMLQWNLAAVREASNANGQCHKNVQLGDVGQSCPHSWEKM